MVRTQQDRSQRPHDPTGPGDVEQELRAFIKPIQQYLGQELPSVRFTYVVAHQLKAEGVPGIAFRWSSPTGGARGGAAWMIDTLRKSFACGHNGALTLTEFGRDKFDRWVETIRETCGELL